MGRPRSAKPLRVGSTPTSASPPPQGGGKERRASSRRPPAAPETPTLAARRSARLRWRNWALRAGGRHGARSDAIHRAFDSFHRLEKGRSGIIFRRRERSRRRGNREGWRRAKRASRGRVFRGFAKVFKKKYARCANSFDTLGAERHNSPRMNQRPWRNRPNFEGNPSAKNTFFPCLALASLASSPARIVCFARVPGAPLPTRKTPPTKTSPQHPTAQNFQP